MKRRVRTMNLEAIGLLAAIAFSSLLFCTGSEAKTNEDEEAIETEVIRMVIEEKPIEVKTNEVDVVEEVQKAEPEYKIFDIGLTEDEQIFMQTICEAYGVDYAFALALMKSESDFRWVEGDQNLTHHAIGYFQISTINEERMDRQYSLDIFDRFDNIEAGIHIISELQEQFKDGYRGYYDTLTCVVMGYKCGVGRGKELMSDGIVLKVVDSIKADMEAYK